MQNKILILGKGFIGTKLQEEFHADISDKMIFSFTEAEKEIKRFNPDLIINCIGITGKNNVDDCEKVLDEALMANTFVPIMLGEVALRYGIRLVHISSGCIYHYDYSKNIPLDEENVPDFFELFYGRTKIYSEEALKVLSNKYPILIVRIRIPLDNQPNPKNILTKLINYKGAIDIPNSITYIPDFIKALKHLIEINATGLFNVVNKGGLRYPELLDVYKKYVPDFEYKVIKFKELNLVRTNLILSTRKLENTGFKVRDIHEVLEECVKKYIKY